MADVHAAPIASDLAGEVVSGVVLRPGEVEVSVIAGYGLPLLEVAAQVRQGVTPLVPGREVHVVIGGTAEPGPQEKEPR
jgi:hypothetical protein